MLSIRLRQTFDAILDEEVSGLPDAIHQVLEEVPLIVEDEPSQALLAEMGLEDGDLCGLHWGTPLTERSLEGGEGGVDHMLLFRGPIIRLAEYSLLHPEQNHDELRRQVRITLLHEIGHHFGLDEDDLDALGYA